MRRLFSSAALADFIYRWRLPADRASSSLARSSSSRAPTSRTSTTTSRRGSRKRIPSTRTTSVSGTSSAARVRSSSRSRPTAADRLFSRETLRVHPAGHRRHRAHRHRLSRRQPGERHDRRSDCRPGSTPAATRTIDGGLDVRPLLEDADTQPPEDVRDRALRDDLLRGDLVSDDGRVTAIVVSFDEDRIDKVRGGVIQQIHDVVDPRLPPGVTRVLQRQPRDQRDLQPDHARQPAQVHAADLSVHGPGASTSRSAPGGRRCWPCSPSCVSVLWTLGLYSLMGFSYNVLSSMLVPLIVVLAIADDVHIMQHWDSVRRRVDNEGAFKDTVAHLAMPLLGASAHDGAGDVVAGHQQRGRRPILRDRFRRRHHGRFRDLAGAGADAAHLHETYIAIAPHEKYLLRPLQAIARLSCGASRRVLIARCSIGLVAACGIFRLKSTPTTSTSLRVASARTVRTCDRPGAVRGLQLPVDAGRPAGFADDAGRLAAHRAAAGRSCGRSRTFGRYFGRRLHQADQQGAERRPRRRQCDPVGSLDDRAGALCVRARRRRSPRARAGDRQRLFACADQRQAAGHELRRRA